MLKGELHTQVNQSGSARRSLHRKQLPRRRAQLPLYIPIQYITFPQACQPLSPTKFPKLYNYKAKCARRQETRGHRLHPLLLGGVFSYLLVAIVYPCARELRITPTVPTALMLLQTTCDFRGSKSQHRCMPNG